MFESYWEAQKQAALLSEAIDLALGIRHLTVVTGGHNGQVAQLLAAAQQGHHQAHMKMCHRGGGVEDLADRLMVQASTRCDGALGLTSVVGGLQHVGALSRDHQQGQVSLV